MRLDDICALPVGELAADDAALFLWTVQPMLPEAMRVLEAWGFTYRIVAFIWNKMPRLWTPDSGRIQPRLGLGYHTRSGPEQCWLAIRGKGYERQAAGVEQVVHAPLRKHSQKPNEIAERIERLVGDVPRIELFARELRPGWVSWGDEVNRQTDGPDPIIQNKRGCVMTAKPKLAVPASDTDPIVDRIEAATSTTTDDPFDLSKLRLSQDFVETAGVRKLLTTIPVRKPGQQDFIRVRSDPAYREAFAVIDLKDDREIYLLPMDIAHELPGETAMVTLYTAINRQGVTFLWPVRLPAADGRINEWHRSAAEAAELAMTRWIRVRANMSLGAYEMFEAASTISDPKWPELSFQELIRIAFRDRLVTSLDHPVIKRLRGA
jgi:N6-adenosine-specific RNA methylase IME4